MKYLKAILIGLLVSVVVMLIMHFIMKNDVIIGWYGCLSYMWSIDKYLNYQEE